MPFVLLSHSVLNDRTWSGWSPELGDTFSRLRRGSLLGAFDGVVASDSNRVAESEGELSPLV